MSSSSTTSATSDLRRSLIAAVLIGVGFMAALDEIIFHQLLAWHHFVEWGTPAFALFSDGLLHSAELILLVFGFFMLADLRACKLFSCAYGWAGLLLGMGGFQLFDGIVDHKILRLHQVRYVDDLWRYDLGWNAAGLFMLGIGVWLLRRARSRHGVR
ncbi:DUF2243 domain-containing protein [Phytohalomonas tamaricis]|uniref:DUF2243 domain-containing protein n=1 Tax=Phytohalomonas tamaricis TaxID=2081032 RepID=UPI000D0BB849|nr:DUF2243 domain-containing protein [Phytohalomonas tamaricis]